MTRITGLRSIDVRFPTSQALDGSDAMNPDPDYSAAYVILETDGPHQGHGLTFTIGRGNEICIAAIEALRPLVVGLDLDWIAADMGRFWRHVTSDSQLRWIGPDKGRSTWPPARWSTPPGTCGRKPRASRSGGWWPRCRPRNWCAASTSVT